jgi:sugar/nucleoside kinase (ribokinase family)
LKGKRLVASSHTSPRILCAGIVVLDEVFRVKQVPAIDTKIDASAYMSVSGGCAANAAVAIARLGGRASFAGPLGDDATADRILAILAHENIDCTGCVRVAGASSSVSAILINDAGERTIVTHSDRLLLAAVPRIATSLVADADCILVDNRRPNFVMPVCVAAQSRSVPIVMDADKPIQLDDPLLALATHVIFSAASLKSTIDHGDLTVGLRQAHAKLNRFVAVTDGSHGALWCERGEVRATPAFPIVAVDTLAAGDIFHGAFALALMEGRDANAAMRFAAAAAALKCLRFGGSASAPTRVELDAFLRRQY